MNNEKKTVKTTLLPGQERVTVVASLPTTPSGDVTANIPIPTVLYPESHCKPLSGIWELAIQEFFSSKYTLVTPPRKKRDA